MVIYDPCGRLNIIYKKLIPAILNSAKNDTADNIRTAIEIFLPKLEEKSYSLATNCVSCIDCGTCSFCNKESIQELFNETQFKLEDIWTKKEKLSNHDEQTYITEFNSIDLVSPGFPAIPS
jgi:hypothetical protein